MIIYSNNTITGGGGDPGILEIGFQLLLFLIQSLFGNNYR